MLMMQHLAQRLSEPPLRDLPVRCVELRFSLDAVMELFAELNAGDYKVRRTGKRNFACCSKTGGIGFRFKLDGRLPGKSFVVRVKK